MANEKRLIDANPLIEKYSGGDELKSMSESLHDSIFVEELRNAPIVDAIPVPDEIFLYHILIDKNGVPEVKLRIGDRILVLHTDPVDLAEVVRCKDCKYQYTPDCTMSDGLGEAVDDDFCSYGERRTDG